VRDLKEEIRSRHEEIKRTFAVNTLYFGGGTPSVLPLQAFEELVPEIKRAFSPQADWKFDEFTVEVNPEDIVEKGKEYVNGLLALGVNRISMGVQSLDDGILGWMKRRHSSCGAREAFGILRECGVKNISVDVIFGIAQLSDSMLQETLREIVGWKPEHISAYQLSIEEGSALAGMVERGLYAEASDEQCRSQYERICKVLSDSGYRHYEISNWALPGYEARHNSAYWKRADYVGLGPGAHSLEGKVRSWNSCCLKGWTSDKEVLTPAEIQEEEIMLGLRTAEGYNGRIIPEEDWFIADSIISDYAVEKAK